METSNQGNKNILKKYSLVVGAIVSSFVLLEFILRSFGKNLTVVGDIIFSLVNFISSLFHGNMVFLTILVLQIIVVASFFVVVIYYIKKGDDFKDVLLEVFLCAVFLIGILVPVCLNTWNLFIAFYSFFGFSLALWLCSYCFIKDSYRRMRYGGFDVDFTPTFYGIFAILGTFGHILKK